MAEAKESLGRLDLSEERLHALSLVADGVVERLGGEHVRARVAEAVCDALDGRLPVTADSASPVPSQP